jgi:hypothetical protein
MLNTEPTRYGAVETPQEGEAYANFLRANCGKFCGVIVCLPNFGDETGAVAAAGTLVAETWEAWPEVGAAALAPLPTETPNVVA